MGIYSTTEEVLNQLTTLVNQFSDEEYREKSELMSGSTIGQHVRHIIEFYHCLFDSYDGAEVCYDNRKRDLSIESSPILVDKLVQNILTNILERKDKPMRHLATVGVDNPKMLLTNTSWERELFYALEHAIHHMAILKIVVKVQYSKVVLEDCFGVASSTLRYQQQCAR